MTCRKEVISLNSNLAGEKMNIEKQFNLIAEEYDSNRRKFIPCFDDFYKNTTEFIVSNIKIRVSKAPFALSIRNEP